MDQKATGYVEPKPVMSMGQAAIGSVVLQSGVLGMWSNTANRGHVGPHLLDNLTQWVIILYL